MTDIGLTAFQIALDNEAKRPLKTCHWCGWDCLAKHFSLDIPEATFCSMACIEAAKHFMATS